MTKDNSFEYEKDGCISMDVTFGTKRFDVPSVYSSGV